MSITIITVVAVVAYLVVAFITGVALRFATETWLSSMRDDTEPTISFLGLIWPLALLSIVVVWVATGVEKMQKRIFHVLSAKLERDEKRYKVFLSCAVTCDTNADFADSVDHIEIKVGGKEVYVPCYAHVGTLYELQNVINENTASMLKHARDAYGGADE